MKVKFYITFVLILTFTLTGCFFTSGGPTDDKIEDLVTKSIENGMDAFCPSPEVQSINVSERGSEIERQETVIYPIRVEITKKCGTNMFSNGEVKNQKISYNFYLDNYGDWKATKTSF